ncbi:hypothetical protein NQD34_001309 [Periophthalmus magnuspinnatus]|nr:hypothetical protein NQD34_001309 [Periophthalmus magnuspinnatus]
MSMWWMLLCLIISVSSLTCLLFPNQQLVQLFKGALFMEMIHCVNASCSNVDDLVNSVTLSVLNVLDTIDPMKVKIVKDQQKAPWRNDDSVRAQKREFWRAEQEWHKSKLQVHYEIYREKMHMYNHSLCRTRERDFSVNY